MRLRDRVTGAAPRVLIGGIGYRWQSDASFGLAVSDALARLDWPEGVDVEDLGYGAIYAAQDIGAAEPAYDRLVLVAGVERGREPGRLYHFRWAEPPPDAAEVQARVLEAGAGVVHVDHLLVLAQHFDALPDDVAVIELEPVDSSGGEGLGPAAAARLEEAIELARRTALEPSAEPETT